MDICVYDKWISVWIDSGYEWVYLDTTDNYLDMQVVSTWIYSHILYGFVCISKMEISLEYTWICKVEYGNKWIS